jgi:hypothetical protein
MAEITARKQNPAAHLAPHKFEPGKSGNPTGRPKGSRNKLGEAFIEALHADFQAHGEATIERARVEDPVAYVKVIASLLPKEVHLSDHSDMSDDELHQRIRNLAAALNLDLGSGTRVGGTGADSRAAAKAASKSGVTH